MLEWIKCKIGDLGEIVGGATPSTKDEANYNGNISWITPKDLCELSGRYIQYGERNITSKGLKSCSAQLLPMHSILFSSRAPIGYVAIAQNELCTNQGFKSVVPNSKTYFLFLYYLLKYNKKRIESMGNGTTFKEISGSTLKDISVMIPKSYQEQKNIAQILDILDKKIENNDAVNDNLQQVIKSCFDFMFATRKPNGIISDILQEHPKSTIQVNDSTGILGDYPFFTSGEAINEWQSALVDGMNCYLSTGGNATIKGYYGKAAYSTDTWCVCGKGEYSFYLFCYLKSIIRSINDSFFAGSGLKHLQKDSLLLVNLYIPSEKELEKFNSIVKPAMETMTKLFLETKKLKQQRDFLLPLLMNGQATIAE